MNRYHAKYCLLALALTASWLRMTEVAAAETAPSAVDGESVIVIVERCNRYIQNAYWFYRDYQWALAIVPTPCARRTQEPGTPFIWDELSRDYSNSHYWQNNHGMRHQLICHLAIARDKPEWNLEPWRPDVGYQRTLEAGCNHVVPLPENAP
ncbi:DUF2599 domain-containing protein [Pseudomonas moraviensis subsp. stanleyae]|uniref:DUF2599 domain-containing protein n=1 Tax=Pseudomonas moraviensis TaxID=321662 RepID=UPI002E3049BD|nr:DUF2599 domain-containing protein [Pseudomonas moraviensis]MED7666296.1 DUF2599 domain-containing protein [Pseudomonas moraviensis subsp. stanleyae]